MKNIIQGINKRSQILLWIFILAYIAYFSYFTILRYKTLYASYYDLGIMNQAVYNTYTAIKEKNSSKILEMTDPDGPDQIKRMAIHNDPLLALLSPFYFIHAGPETLVVIQTIVLAFGAWAVFKIAQQLLSIIKNKDFLALVFAVGYLLYTPMQRANIFDFHAVTLATSFLLFMFYFWLIKRYWLSFVFFILSILTKEQVALTTLVFGIYAYFMQPHKKGKYWFPPVIVGISLLWFLASVFVIIPYFRGHHSFALQYYGDFGDSPIRIIIGIFKSPYSVIKYVVQVDTWRYFFFLLGPLGFLSLLSPLQFVIALPELAINLLSNNGNMRNIIFHYTAVIQPFVFISAIYGLKKLIDSGQVFRQAQDIEQSRSARMILLLFFSLIFSYFKGPLPFTREADIHPFKYPQISNKEVQFWAQTLKDDSLKVSTTGQVAPYFTSRQYFYIFSERYVLTDYIIIRLREVYKYPEKDKLIPIYNRLKNDKNFKRIYRSDRRSDPVEVYKKI